MTITAWLFKLARASATGRSLRRGRIVKREENIVKGRMLARAGFWRRLWR